LAQIKKRPLLLGIAAAVAVICLIAALGLLYFALNISNEDSDGLVGSSAPDFNLPSLNGKSLSLEELHGKPVLLNFWATWCQPCLAEMPLLDATAQTHLGNLVIVGVNEGDLLADVQSFVKRERLGYPVLLDYDEQVGNLYRLSGYPTSVFIDAEGIIRAIYLGEIPPEQLKKNLRLIGIE